MDLQQMNWGLASICFIQVVLATRSPTWSMLLVWQNPINPADIKNIRMYLLHSAY